MTSLECEEQLNELIKYWNEDYTTRINATDIEAIKHLMLENKMQHDKINQLNNSLRTYEIVLNSNVDAIREHHVLNELEEWLELNWKESQDIWFVKIINKIQELKGNKYE